MLNEILIPRTLDAVIVALCADYPRRACAIEMESMPFNVVMEYRFLNYRILNAAMEASGERDALKFINEIGSRRGYVDSETYLSESVYKNRKREVKENIAKKLSLI